MGHGAITAYNANPMFIKNAPKIVRVTGYRGAGSLCQFISEPRAYFSIDSYLREVDHFDYLVILVHYILYNLHYSSFVSGRGGAICTFLEASTNQQSALMSCHISSVNHGLRLVSKRRSYFVCVANV